MIATFGIYQKWQKNQL